MKKIDNRDLPNMQTSQDIIRRYDLSALDQLSVKKGNNAAVGVGMEPTVAKGVQSKDGFYDENGDNIFTTSELLPNGDASQIAYWQGVEAGNYWYNYTISTIADMPSGYGFVDVYVNGTGISILYHRMTTNYIYHRAVSSGTITPWVQLISTDDISVEFADDKIVQRDGSGNIFLFDRINFNNNDYIRLDDSANKFVTSIDAGAEQEILTLKASGSFSPVLFGDSTYGSMTYSNNYGTYRKYGGLVIVKIKIEVSNFSTYPTGNYFIGGFPYDFADWHATLPIFYSYGGSNSNLSHIVGLHAYGGNNKARIRYIDGNGTINIMSSSNSPFSQLGTPRLLIESAFMYYTNS